MSSTGGSKAAAKKTGEGINQKLQLVMKSGKVKREAGWGRGVVVAAATWATTHCGRVAGLVGAGRVADERLRRFCHKNL